MAICEQCGKEHDGSFGSGRFCCRSCSNRWVALNQSDEAKARKIEAGRKNLVHDGTVGFCAPGYWTEENRASQSTRMKEVMSDYEIRCKLSDSLKGKVPDEETRKKISDSLLKAVEEGRHKGFQYSKEPYSEYYVEKFLELHGVIYCRQHIYRYVDSEGRSRRYYLDFYLPEYNIDLEVDGSFHLREPQLSRDLARDIIVSKDMKVFRLRWDTVGSQNLTDELSRLLTILNMQV